MEVCLHPIHEGFKAPEGVNLILHDREDWRGQVTHAPAVAQVHVVHAVGEQYVAELLEVLRRALHIRRKIGVSAVGPRDVLVHAVNPLAPLAEA